LTLLVLSERASVSTFLTINAGRSIFIRPAKRLPVAAAGYGMEQAKLTKRLTGRALLKQNADGTTSNCPGMTNVRFEEL